MIARHTLAAMPITSWYNFVCSKQDGQVGILKLDALDFIDTACPDLVVAISAMVWQGRLAQSVGT